MRQAAETYMMQDWLCVKGNNDWYSDFPNQIKFKVEDLNFLVAHAGIVLGIWIVKQV